MTIATLLPIIRANIQKETAVMTDDGRWYNPLGENFARHETINHSAGEYVRRVFKPVLGGVIVHKIHANTVEGYYSNFKRGMQGRLPKHLHRNLAEFDFRYSHRVRLGYSDEMRATLAIKGAANKRLTYRKPRISGLPVLEEAEAALARRLRCVFGRLGETLFSGVAGVRKAPHNALPKRRCVSAAE